MHCPATVTSPSPTAMEGMLVKYSNVLITACAAICEVGSVAMVLWITNLPNWNMPFSTPVGIPIRKMVRISRKSGRISA